MFQSHELTRDQAREWLRQETAQRRPPPTPVELHHQHSWDLVDFEYDDRCTLSILETPA